MKKNLQIAAVCAALMITAFGAVICSAQSEPIVGGFRAVSKTDETVVQAADFAVATQAQKDSTLKLNAIENAERQIVAGSNYRMCLSVTANGKAEQATATVYLNLQNKFSLSKWQAGKCAVGKTDETDETDEEDEDDTVSYKGALQVGKTNSTILYVGAETGDYAAFCFTNNSPVGRAVLKACKNGGQCEFVGKVDFDNACTVKNLEADLSASGKITSIESVKAFAPKTAASKVVAPDVVVKNLYAAQKSPKNAPFFQNNNRAAIDKFFEEDFADLIWNDATEGNDGVGTINFDPLFNAQDQVITAFVIGKPKYADDIATVPVSFKNFGKAQTIKFYLEKQADKSWKIKDIVYADGTALVSMLFDAKLGEEAK